MFICDWKSFFIGILSSIIILMGAYFYFQGSEYRRISNAYPLSVFETVGTLPSGKQLIRYIVPYKGRFHYVYVTNDTVTINKRTINGKTTNMESETFVK